MTELRELHAERVARGAELLDEHRPGWFLDVEVGKLDLNDCLSCVLGQVFKNEQVPMRNYPDQLVSNYDAGVELLVPEGQESFYYGFNLEYRLVRPDGVGEFSEAWEELYDLWVEQIKDRYMNSVD